MIINYFEFKSENFNGHNWIISDLIDRCKYDYKCKICGFEFYRLLGNWQESEFEDTIFVKLTGKYFNQLWWDDFDNEILSCNEYIIKSIIE